MLLKRLLSALRQDLASSQARFNYLNFLLARLPGRFGTEVRSCILPRFFKSAGKGVQLNEGSRYNGVRGLAVGDRVSIGIDNFLQASGGLTIGNDTILAPGVKIWTVTHRFESPDQPISEQGYVLKPVTIGANVWLGSNVFVMPGVELPDGCIVSAGSVVGVKKYAPYSIIAGNPARVIGNQAGAPREGEGGNLPTCRPGVGRDRSETMSDRNREIAVVIPCYNGEAFLAAAVESVLRQSLPAAEILVVDDGSTDGSREVAARFSAPVRCVARTNGGVSSARNAGVALTRSELILFLDADDELKEDALETLAGALAARDDAGVAFGLFEEVREGTGQVLPPRDDIRAKLDDAPHLVLPGGGYLFTEGLFSPLLRGSFIPMGGTMLRRSLVARVGGFDEGFRVGEDRDLWLRAIRVAPFVCVNRVVMRRRVHDANLTGIRYQQLYRDFNIELARRLCLALRQLTDDDRGYLAGKAAESARLSARHFLGEGNCSKGRGYAVEYAAWQGWNLEAASLFALSFVPGFILTLARRGKERAATLSEGAP